MSAIVPFGGDHLPAYLKTAESRKLLAKVNADVAVGAQYPTLSIKGKVFTIVQNNEQRLLTKPDAPDEVLQHINLAVIRGNPKARIYYKNGYKQGDNTPPTCSSNDGETPSRGVADPQAKKCAICPHAVWGTKVLDDGTTGQGTECTVNTRLAVADPDKLDVQLLLRVPAGSRKAFNEAVKAGDTRGIPYNAMVMKVGFDPTAPAPKLTFKPIGLLSDEAYAKVRELYDSDLVKDIIGLSDAPAAEPAAPAVQADELDAAIAAKAAVAKAAAPAPVAPPVAPAPVAPAPVAAAPVAPPAAAKPAAAPAADLSNLLGDLDALLKTKDD